MEKLVVYNDLINAIRKIKDTNSVMKVVRNDKKKFFCAYLPCCIACNYITTGNGMSLLPFEIAGYLFVRKRVTTIKDTYQKEGEQEIESLNNSIRGSEVLSIDTDKELLKESKLEKKRYSIRLNEDKLPVLLQSKLITVPAHKDDGTIEGVSLLQEHAVGSKNYYLSRPMRQLHA